MSDRKKNFSRIVSLAGACVAAALTVAFLIYSMTYSEYFDVTVLACFALGAAGLALYALLDGVWTEFMNLLAVFTVSFGAGLFIINSFPVIGDWYGNFNMYGSRGGIGPVVGIVGAAVFTVLLGIISCFTCKEVKKS